MRRDSACCRVATRCVSTITGAAAHITLISATLTRFRLLLLIRKQLYPLFDYDSYSYARFIDNTYRRATLWYLLRHCYQYHGFPTRFLWPSSSKLAKHFACYEYINVWLYVYNITEAYQVLIYNRKNHL